MCVAISVGALKSVSEVLQSNSRQSGICLRLAKSIHKKANKLKGISPKEVEIITDCINMSAEMVDSLKGENYCHMMLNLASFCMEEIKHILSPNDFWNLRKLFDCFSASDSYNATRLGDRIFTRLMSELEITVKESTNEPATVRN